MNHEECLFCQIEATPLESPGDIRFDCRRLDEEDVGILTQIPFQVDLPQSFVEKHLTALQSGKSVVCIPGGRAVRFPNSTIPDQVVIPEGSNIELLPGSQDPVDGSGVGFGNRTMLVVRVSGTGESPEESVERLKGAVFGLGRQPFTNSMRAQYGRCSFSKIDFIPASGYDQFDNGVMNIQLDYRLTGKQVFRVLNDAIELVAEVLGGDSLGDVDHVMFCIARGTIYPGESEWSAFATLNGWRSIFNSERCDSLSYLMHEIGHNLGLVHSAADFVGNSYDDTTGMVSLHSGQFCIVSNGVSQTTDVVHVVILG